MYKIDRNVFETEFLSAEGACLKSDLKTVGAKGVTEKMIHNFDRIMQAKTTDDVKDLSWEEIADVARYASDIAILYKQTRFLADTTFENIRNAKGVKKKRLL